MLVDEFLKAGTSWLEARHAGPADPGGAPAEPSGARFPAPGPLTVELSLPAMPVRRGIVPKLYLEEDLFALL